MVFAKKSFGQHFLKDDSIAQRIADSLTGLTEQVLEVGPGRGMLTKFLLAKPQCNLKVVEADRDMVSYLNENMPALANRIIAEDFLKVKFNDIFPEGQFSLIGNYPYNISSQIVIRTIDERERIPEMSGMFQKEVAERVAAKEDTEAYGVLSALTQAFFDVSYLFTVKPGSFNPPPKVNSGVIRLTRRPDHDNIGCDPILYRKVVKAAFAQRRKMMRNTLLGFLPKELLMDEDFFKRRAETLSIKEFIALTQRIETHRKTEQG